MSKRRKFPEYRIQFYDEVPSIGSGMRGISVVKLGRKWVKIVEVASGTTARVTVAMWRTFPKHVMRRGKQTDEVVY